ncbi:MAG: class II aldolase/adducin family protein [Oscillospiraceae bacterium]|nr:class II aldolase/adducin family protein [Oscillospiraceae bacterium]
MDILGDLEAISHYAGQRVDYVQGGGGNTSVKGGGLMAVKASGFRLSQVGRSGAYVLLDYGRIADYYGGIGDLGDRDYESESKQLVSSAISPQDTLGLRPSVEAGFHSILRKYVIHTHSVYANVLCCSSSGEAKVAELFGGYPDGPMWVPYINPGFCLTLRIMDSLKGYGAAGAEAPKAIFMENHGLVVTSDDMGECMELHTRINDGIISCLGLERFPDVSLAERGSGAFESRTGLVVGAVRSGLLDRGYAEGFLSPDHIVYLGGALGFGDAEAKASVDSGVGSLTYRCGYAEAMAVEETLASLIYVREAIARLGLGLKAMSEKEADFIRNWEMESYRRSLVSEFKR